jgi:ABC-type bacteriocin/lantibiotic exporter with double-glycine peptidase domain
LLLQLVLAASSLITSEGMRRGTQAIENKSMDMLFSVASFILVVSLLNIALSYFSKVMRTKTELKYEQEIQSSLLTKITNLNKIRFNEYKTGEVITIIVNNANEVSANIIDSIYGIFTGTSVILACIIYMAVIDWKIMIVILI